MERMATVGDHAAGRLPPLQAEVILLRVVAGLGNDVMARLLGGSPGAGHLRRLAGLRQLAHILSDAGVTL